MGVNSLTIGTHPLTPRIVEGIRNDDYLKNNLNIYPSMPSPAKILRMTSELGIPKTLFNLISQTSLSSKFKLLYKGGISGLINKDINSILEALIEVELSIFSGLNVKGVFLSNNINDLALGLDLSEMFINYVRILKNKSIIPCFNTVNLPFFVNKMKEYEIEPLPVMAAANSKGFFVNPSIASFESTLKDNDVRLVAMSILASGSLSSKDAFKYLGTLENLESLTFGASSKSHIKENLTNIGKYLSW